MLIALCLATILVADEKVDSYLPKQVQDFVVGLGIGALHGAINKKLAQPLYKDDEDRIVPEKEKIVKITSFMLSHEAILLYDKNNYLHSPTVIGACVGQMATESLIESYDSLDDEFKPAIVLNWNTIIALGSHLYESYSKKIDNA